MNLLNSCKKKILVSAALLLLHAQPVWAYPSPVAVITNYDDIAAEITIQRASGEPDGAEALLYPNDRISGAVDKLEVDYAPYAKAETAGGAYCVAYEPPSEIWQVAQNVTNYVSSFWENIEGTVTGASRGGEHELNLNPRPGFHATVMMSQPVSFGWDTPTNKTFTVRDETGKVITEQKVEGKTEVVLVPSECGMMQGKKYTWAVDGDFREYEISVLDAQTEQKLTEALQAMDAEQVSEEQRLLKKAKYLQLLSDMYPDKVDLYWYSEALLQQAEAQDSASAADKALLLKKCKAHLDKEM